MDTSRFDYNLARDKLEKDGQYKNRIIYSLPVRVDNWNEDLSYEEERLRLANNKRVRCELLVEKTRAMLKNLLRPVKMAEEQTYVEFGKVFQIKAPAIPNSLQPSGTFGLYLSGLMTERDIDYGTHFTHSCGLTASPDKTPCVRNTFIFRGCDQNRDNQPIMYGQDTYIQIYESGICAPLYVQCECASYDSFGSHLQPRLTQSPDIYCRFKIFHWNPTYRYETEGSSFAPNEKIIIQHTASGRNLAVEYNQWIPTFFGPECSVTCHTFQDTHRMETAENLWQILQFIGFDKTLFVRAAKGEDIPPELLE